MWNAKAKLIPVMTGVTGPVSELPRQYLSNIRGWHEMKGLQKTVTHAPHAHTRAHTHTHTHTHTVQKVDC